MPELRWYNIFISHAWKYGEEYDRFEALLRDAPNFRFLNWSAPSDKPLILPGSKVSEVPIRKAIEAKIKMADCVLIIGGMYAAHSEWMQEEIDIAKSQKKSLIGIRPWGNEKYPISVLLATDVDVGWNTDSIVDAIRTHARDK